MIRYGVGALAILAISIGMVMIIYGSGFIELDILNIPVWIFGPLGAYTLIYGIVSQRDPLYFILWGAVMLTISFASALHTIINPIIIIGISIIVIVILSFMVLWRARG
ncbi:MAG: hypothetical protein NZ929_05390 [Aigarchaeota archaeon]|nr:hypothetical protein [Aigarchaeota archaeon]MDW7985860.1 hypothetical protein [Nitrososphaerota archaeon]